MLEDESYYRLKLSFCYFFDHVPIQFTYTSILVIAYFKKSSLILH